MSVIQHCNDREPTFSEAELIIGLCAPMGTAESKLGTTWIENPIHDQVLYEKGYHKLRA